MSHLILIDASGFAYRAHYAYPARHRADGLPVHAVLGFMGLIWKTLGRAGEVDPPAYAAAIFDAPAKTFRHRLYPEYKAHRKRPEELGLQLPMMREAARVLGIEPIEKRGYEADDLIATLATHASANRIRTTIVSVDKDMHQLVVDGVVEIADPVQRRRILSADVKAKFGVEPYQVPDVQALCGDEADGIPGIPGIGMKRAAALIRHYVSVESLAVAVAANRGITATPAVRAALRQGHKDLALYKKLTTLKRDVPIEIDFETLRPKPAFRSEVEEMLRAMDALDVMDRMFGLIGGEVVFRRVDKLAGDHFAWWRTEVTRRSGQSIPAIPQCGFYRRRLVKGGPYVPAKIWREADVNRETGERSNKDRLLCEVNGERADPNDAWGYLCTNPIAEAEFVQMTKGGPVKGAKVAICWNDEPI